MNKPNIILIITDQHNIDAISAYKDRFPDHASGPHHLHTPNIDRMIHGGCSFLLSHTANPVSCPARASIFTGRYSIEHGVTYNNIGIDNTVPNLGQWLGEKSDYRCFYAGKWHAGGKWNYPEREGNRKIPGFETIPIGEFALGAHTDYQVATAVKNFLYHDNSQSPFFLVAGLMNPHDICFWTTGLRGKSLVSEDELTPIATGYPPIPPNNAYEFDEPERLGKTRQRQSPEFWKNYAYDYYRMVEKADLDIGRILDAVEARKDNTVVIFTSDHGEGIGRHSRVQKWHPYDQSVKVPLVFYAPGYIVPQVDKNTLVSGIDIFPTICAIAGIKPPDTVNGNNLLPLLCAEKKKLDRNHVIVEFMHTGRVVRNERFKYVKMYAFSDIVDQPFVDKNGHPTVFVPGEHDTYETDPIELLFDMQTDPWELHNLANDDHFGQVKRDMEQLLDKWERSVKPGKHFDRN
jgi:arylsulfatase A-like enzyme